MCKNTRTSRHVTLEHARHKISPHRIHWAASATTFLFKCTNLISLTFNVITVVSFGSSNKHPTFVFTEERRTGLTFTCSILRRLVYPGVWLHHAVQPPTNALLIGCATRRTFALDHRQLLPDQWSAHYASFSRRPILSGKGSSRAERLPHSPARPAQPQRTKVRPARRAPTE